jgi:hypothetical protein
MCSISDVALFTADVASFAALSGKWLDIAWDCQIPFCLSGFKITFLSGFQITPCDKRKPCDKLA